MSFFKVFQICYSYIFSYQYYVEAEIKIDRLDCHLLVFCVSAGKCAVMYFLDCHLLVFCVSAGKCAVMYLCVRGHVFVC